MKTILFACVHNAGRSQMAAALFNATADPKQARAMSAGTAPATQVHPEVVAAMRELGIYLSDATPTLLTDALVRNVDILVTMGCGEQCPVVPGVQRLDWDLPDPKGREIQQVRAIRDDIKARVEHLVSTLTLEL